MTIGNTIHKLRTGAKLTQEQLAELLGVSQQSVQKWEKDITTPDVDNIVQIAKHFGVSLDALVLGNSPRVVEETYPNTMITPDHDRISSWEFYSGCLRGEYKQCIDEGLDLSHYDEVFQAIIRLPRNKIKLKFSDVIFDIVSSAPMREDYPYTEPSDLEGIRQLRIQHITLPPVDKSKLPAKITGAWMGRIAGCMLGKTVEGIHTEELTPFLQESGNLPMHRYIYRSDITEDVLNGKYKYNFAGRIYADEIDAMPVDDDINYLVLAQGVIEQHGRDFTPFDVAQYWMNHLTKRYMFTAERTALGNFYDGYFPPKSAIYKNPFREWIGAQIRGDYFGYINPGNPEAAAEMAWRDASLSHVKNGIYGEMFVSAMLAAAAAAGDIEDIIQCGLGEIPPVCRLRKGIDDIINAYHTGASYKDCIAMVHERFDQHNYHGWCHTIPNAMIVVAALLYGDGDFGKSICMAIEAGFDTDCNGATIGSIFGMTYGIESIPAYWTKPFNDTLHTALMNASTLKISDCIQTTLKHIDG